MTGDEVDTAEGDSLILAELTDQHVTNRSLTCQPLSDKATEQLQLSPSTRRIAAYCVGSSYLSRVDVWPLRNPLPIWNISLLLTEACENPAGSRQQNRPLPQNPTSSRISRILQTTGSMRQLRRSAVPLLVLACAASTAWARKRPFNIHDDILAYPQVRCEDSNAH